MDAELKSYVSSLNEFAQKKNWTVSYALVNTDGQEHLKTFTVSVVVVNGKSYRGLGQTKEEAKQNAAKNALSALTNDELINTVSDENASREDKLNQSSSNTRFAHKVIKDTKTFPEGWETFAKEAKQKAAWSECPDSGLISQEQSNINAVSNTVPHQPPTSRFLEDFDIKSIKRTGRGGFGRVFKARRKLEDTTFAVKIVKFNQKARREVEALSSLNHPNIVRYHTSWTENTAYRDGTSESSSASSSESGSEFLYIQMEFCEGETLEKWIKKRNDHPEKYPERRQKATEIIKQVLKAVKFVHLKKLYHRDLKPVNIMFGPDGGVKVVDFGLVTNEERDDDGRLLERTKGVGTHSYMSPEQVSQIQGRVYDRKVDIYAVGLIYFVLLWRFGTQSEKTKLWNDIRSKKFPEDFFKSFDFEHKLIERMLCEKPEERSEASDLLTELEQHSATAASPELKVSGENASGEDNLNQSSSNTRFAYKVDKDNKEFPEGREMIAKEAKQKAAWSECPDSGLISQEQSNINAVSDTVSHQPPTSRFLEEFDIKSIKRTGRGGFGRVFKARRKLEDTTFAVKIVKFNEKALREVEALSSLDHPNIVRYHTSWTENTAYRDETSDSSSASFSESGSEFLYIQMEFCEGETLREWIEKRNDHPEKYPERRQKATEIIKQVLKAVKFIHLNTLIHRDLKPANIMSGPNGGVKVVDFGLVTNEERDDDGRLLERTKEAGTRSYMSPEQIQGQVYDRKVDIYAVGLIYFVLLWRFGTQSEKIKLWHEFRSKKFPEEFSKSFDFEHKLIERMLCEKPEERSEASDLLTELEQHSATAASPEHKIRKENRTY